MYLKRIVDDVLDKITKMIGGVYIGGPKWCGKTTTLKRRAKTSYFLSTSKDLNQLKSAFDIDPDIIFNEGNCPILFDEWQIFPQIWDEGRGFIDACSNKGTKIFLTGSTTVSKKDWKTINHSGVGRYDSLLMRPLSLFESLESNGSASLNDIFQGKIYSSLKSTLTIKMLINAACRGGWPEAVTNPGEDIQYYAKTIIKMMEERELEGGLDFSGKKESGIILNRLFRSYAKNDSTLASNNTIINDIRKIRPSFSESSFYRYKEYLDGLFVFEDVPSWSSNLKSKVNMVSSAKKEFIDPSLAIAALGASPKKMEEDLFDFGFFFENLVIRDLRIYSMKYGGNVYYYHDRTGLEADAVLVRDDNTYALIEIKLGEKSTIEGANHLLEIRDKIIRYNEQADRDEKMDLPSALIVVTGGNIGGTRKDGVQIVPIGCLRD